MPALTESARIRLFAFAALYAAQGVPQGLFVFALPAYMAQRGITPAEIGSFVALALLPWSFKLVTGPVMDRWSFRPMGLRRPWVLAAQAGIAATFAAMAFVPDPLQHVGWLGGLAFLNGVFAATQDVATDGMAISVLPIDEQARANGFMWGGKALGVSGTTAGAAWLLSAQGFPAALIGAAAAVGLGMLVPLLLRERPGERLLPWSRGEASPTSPLRFERWADILRALSGGMTGRASLVAIAAFFAYGSAEGLAGSTLPVFTVRELGWQDTAFSQLSASARFGAGMLAMIVGGALVQRMGRIRAMSAGTMLYAVALLTLALAPDLWRAPGAVSGFIVAFAVLETLLTVALLSIGMALCHPRIAATQFAIYMALANLGYSAGASLLGPVHGRYGYAGALAIAATASLVSFGLLLSVRLRHLPHRADDVLTRGEAGAAVR